MCKVTTKNIQNIVTIKSPKLSLKIPWCTNEWIIDLSMLSMSKPLLEDVFRNCARKEYKLHCDQTAGHHATKACWSWSDFATITSCGCALPSFMHGGYVCRIKDSSRVRNAARNYGGRSAAMMIWRLMSWLQNG
jgi:hypothetical protein